MSLNQSSNIQTVDSTDGRQESAEPFKSNTVWQRYAPLICLALMHTIVDACALLVAPLWPEYESLYALQGLGLTLVFIVQSLPTSISQGVFGFFRDRRSIGFVLWLGPLVAILSLTAIGCTSNLFVFCILFIVGGIGVGAFHPEAAVAVGRMIPENRTRALSVFMLGGSLGLALGPTLSGAIFRVWGLQGLLVLAPVFLLLLGILYWLGGFAKTARNIEPVTSKPSLYQMFDGRIGLAILVLAVCSLRLVPNMAMDKVISFVMDQRKEDRFITGLFQSLFLVSASGGMILMVFIFRSGWERRFMIACPLLGMPLLLALGWPGCPNWLFVSLLVPTGFVLWGTTPAMVSYAQQLFPRGAGMASAITLGLAWGIGGLLHAPVTSYYRQAETPQTAFWGFIPFLALAGIGAMLLPKVDTEASSDSVPS